MVGPGRVQLESGVTRDDADGVANTSFGELLVRVGLTDHVELRLYPNSFVRRSTPGAADNQGIEDSRVGVKLRLLNPDSLRSALMPRLTAVSSATIPDGSNGIGAGVVLADAKLSASWSLPRRFSLYSNAGLGTVLGDGGSRGLRQAGSVALWYSATPAVSVFSELYAAAGRNAVGVAAVGAADAGATWLVPGGRLQFDVRAGRSVVQGTHERFVGAGMAALW